MFFIEKNVFSLDKEVVVVVVGVVGVVVEEAAEACFLACSL